MARTVVPGEASLRRSACSTADSSYPASTHFTPSGSSAIPFGSGRRRVSASGTGLIRTAISTAPRGSGVPLEELAGDHDALDLVRAFVDLRELGVAEQLLDGVLLHVAVPAEH